MPAWIPPAVFAAVALLCGTATAAAVFLTGADVSFQPQLRRCGAVYRDGGQPRDLLPLLREEGFSLARLRLWHRPAPGDCDLTATLSLARDCRAAGLQVMLDLHYADSWADPGRQPTPAAWRDLPAAALADSVRAYTADVLGAFRDAGVPLAYVQLGNEVDAGFLWDRGRIGPAGGAWDVPAQREAFVALMRAAVEGARQALPPRCGTQLVVQAAAGGDTAGCRRLFDLLRDGDVAFDVVAVSYYPWWHGGLSALEANLRQLAARYAKPVLVAETAYPFTLDWADDTRNFVGAASPLPDGIPATPAGQAAFAARLRELVAAVPGGLGIVWWAPDLVPAAGGPGNPCENLALFDFAGEALPALSAFAGRGTTGPEAGAR